jgi:hypothetical protein
MVTDELMAAVVCTKRKKKKISHYLGISVCEEEEAARQDGGEDEKSDGQGAEQAAEDVKAEDAAEHRGWPVRPPNQNGDFGDGEGL